MATEFSMVDKPVKAKKKLDRRRADEPKFSVNGRPTKRTPEMEKALLAAVETGAPYRIACLACGISDDAFAEWRRKDPVFAAQVAQASGKTALRLLKKIEKNADENFSAAAWILERRFPESFSRPEIQLAQVHHQTSITHNSLVISAEMAGALSARSVPIHAKVEQLFASQAREASLKLPEGAVTGDLPAAEMKLPLLTMPPAPVPSHWWGQLVCGDNTREVERETAIKICRMILEDVVGKQRAQSTSVEFAPGSILLRDVHSKLEAVCGARGWAALTKRGKTRK
jgi:transposase